MPQPKEEKKSTWNLKKKIQVIHKTENKRENKKQKINRKTRFKYNYIILKILANDNSLSTPLKLSD